MCIVSIATFHVQDFTISNATNNGDINITCIFAIGSTAAGCRVDLTNNDCQRNITVQKDSFNTTTVPDGTYDVTVCDVVGSDTVVAITTTTTIINVLVPTTDTPGMMYILSLLILLVAIHVTTTDTPVTLTSTADYTVVTTVPTSDEERTSKGLLLACTCIIHYIDRAVQ